MTPVRFSGIISGIRLAHPQAPQKDALTPEQLHTVLQQATSENGWRANFHTQRETTESFGTYAAPKTNGEPQDQVLFTPPIVKSAWVAQIQVAGDVSAKDREKTDKTDMSLIGKLLQAGVRGFRWAPDGNSASAFTQVSKLLKEQGIPFKPGTKNAFIDVPAPPPVTALPLKQHAPPARFCESMANGRTRPKIFQCIQAIFEDLTFLLFPDTLIPTQIGNRGPLYNESH